MKDAERSLEQRDWVPFPIFYLIAFILSYLLSNRTLS